MCYAKPRRHMDGKTYAQTFNAENRLVSVIVNSATTQFIYDGDGNMVKQINPDGSKIIFVSGAYQEVKDSNDVVTETRIYYPAGGAMRINGVLSYRLTDHLGSTVAVTDSSGNIVNEQRYMPFGQQRLINANQITDKTYTGQRNVESIGLMDYRARFYSASLGRFIQADTIVPNSKNPQAFNRYSYTANNPINFNDPTGHAWDDCANKNTNYGCQIHMKNAAPAIAEAHWQDMIAHSKPGDVLFGTTSCNYAGVTNSCPPTTFMAFFTGNADGTITGISGIRGVYTGTTLADIQRGSAFFTTPNGSGITITYNWVGKYRVGSDRGLPDKNGWYIRPGYERTENPIPDWTSNVVGEGVEIGAGLGLFRTGYAGCAGGISGALCGLGFAGAGALTVDALDLETGDYQIQAGPVYFNSQCQSCNDPTNRYWTLEHTWIIR